MCYELLSWIPPYYSQILVLKLHARMAKEVNVMLFHEKKSSCQLMPPQLIMFIDLSWLGRCEKRKKGSYSEMEDVKMKKIQPTNGQDNWWRRIAVLKPYPFMSSCKLTNLHCSLTDSPPVHPARANTMQYVFHPSFTSILTLLPLVIFSSNHTVCLPFIALFFAEASMFPSCS